MATVSARMDRLELALATQVEKLEAADAAIRWDFRAAMRNLEDRMTVKMGLMFATAIGILAAIIKL